MNKLLKIFLFRLFNTQKIKIIAYILAFPTIYICQKAGMEIKVEQLVKILIEFGIPCLILDVGVAIDKVVREVKKTAVKE